MVRPILMVEGLNLHVKDRYLLKDVSFQLPPCGITALMGPVGTGKSSLLKWLCGVADPDVYQAKCENAEYFYGPLTDRNRPKLFSQHEATSVDEAMALFNNALRRNPALFCIDEVTARLSERDTEMVLQRLAIMAQSRSLLIVSHNQKHMERYADNIMLLAGGVVQEFTPAGEFFAQPRSEAGRQFLRTGGVVTANIGVPSRHLRSDLREVPAGLGLDGTKGNANGLQSVFDGKLFIYTACTDGPSATVDVDFLRNEGVTSVVFVDGEEPSEIKAIEDQGLSGVWCPQMDKKISLTSCKQRCQELQCRLDAQEKLAVVGRQGDPRAARAVVFQLIYMGLSADKATEVFGQLMGKCEVSMEDEQLLWDLELALDLESDGLDASLVEQKDTPDISWIEQGGTSFRVSQINDEGKRIERRREA